MVCLIVASCLCGCVLSLSIMISTSSFLSVIMLIVLHIFQTSFFTAWPHSLRGGHVVGREVSGLAFISALMDGLLIFACRVFFWTWYNCVMCLSLTLSSALQCLPMIWVLRGVVSLLIIHILFLPVCRVCCHLPRARFYLIIYLHPWRMCSCLC